MNIQNNVPEEIIEIDETKMIVALRNLVDNANKYGIIKEQINVFITKENNIVSFNISNKCEDMNEDEIEFLFKPFFRMKNSKTKVHHGFGLGLTICQKIVVAHGGNLLLKSDDSETVFTIELPFEFN